MTKIGEIMLKVENLRTYFPVKSSTFLAPAGCIKSVDDVSFEVPGGSTFGLVGQSGAGKTTLARTIAGLIPPTSGNVFFEGHNILKLSARLSHDIRRRLAIIFQDPFSSLNSRLTVRHIVADPLVVHKLATGTQLSERVARALLQVGLSPDYMNRYPHEFSGGERQRIAIARALVLEPRLVICDEPVSSLDASVQAQILNLLKDLQQQQALTYLFISHDLAVVEFMSDTVAVMYGGRVIEQAPAELLCRSPLHPYTQTLVAAVPRMERPHYSAPHPGGKHYCRDNPPAGCRFYPRCQKADSQCAQSSPPLTPTNHCASHLVACWKCHTQNPEGKKHYRP